MYGEFDIKESIGRQPLSLTAVTKGGDVLYDLRVWHESHRDTEGNIIEEEYDGEEKKIDA